MRFARVGRVVDHKKVEIYNFMDVPLASPHNYAIDWAK
jgi:hypothetical protein